MKTRINGFRTFGGSAVLASFGGARLVARRDGRMELRGGSSAERTEAKEWISLFAHELVLAESSAGSPRGAASPGIRASMEPTGLAVRPCFVA